MALQRWESCIYTADEERGFLKNYLRPTLETVGLGDKNIVIWDHNRDLISDSANTIFDDLEASKYAGVFVFIGMKHGQVIFLNIII
jgi:glucosylceramidase